MSPRITKRGAGIVGAVLGITAAGVAAGVAAERYVVRRSRQGDDPYAAEPFGALEADVELTVETADGVDLHVEILEAQATGQDVTVIFVHGFCLDMGTFHFQRTAFDGRYRMVFYDQPGHGRSGRLAQGEYTLENLATALASVIDRTAPTGRIVLVGHSMGGMAIMALAEYWPQLVTERVAGVALISSSSGQMRKVSFGMPQIVAQIRGPLLPVVRTAGPVAAGVVDRVRQVSTDLAWLLTRKYGFGTPRPSSTLVSYVERMNSATSLDVIARYLNTIHGHDRVLALQSLRAVPVLVICGDRDLITPPEHSRTIVEEIPEAEFFVVKDGGHVALLEHSDEVNGILAGFFRKVCA